MPRVYQDDILEPGINRLFERQIARQHDGIINALTCRKNTAPNAPHTVLDNRMPALSVLIKVIRVWL